MGFNIGFRLAAFFTGLILLPASILTYLSVRAFQDEQRSALADLHLRVPALRSAFDVQQRQVADRAFAQAAGGGGDSAASPYVKARFVLDENGEFLLPRVLRAQLGERSEVLLNC